MPYFWKGVAMRNLCISMQAKDSGEKDAGMIDLRNAFRHFIKIAPQEGRFARPGGIWHWSKCNNFHANLHYQRKRNSR